MKQLGHAANARMMPSLPRSASRSDYQRHDNAALDMYSTDNQNRRDSKMSTSSKNRASWALVAALAAIALIAAFFWRASDSPSSSRSDPLLSMTSASVDGADRNSDEIHRKENEEAKVEKTEEESSPAADIDTPSISDTPDPRPHAYTPGHILVTLESDDWLNPEKLKLTDEEKRKIREFVNADSLAFLDLEQTFHKKLNELGKQLIEQGKFDGRVNEKELSDDERNKLPYLTEDWLNPYFISWSGGFRTWIKIDLRKEDPGLADLRIAGWEEQAAARARLRDFIAELARKR